MSKEQFISKPELNPVEVDSGKTGGVMKFFDSAAAKFALYGSLMMAGVGAPKAANVEAQTRAGEVYQPGIEAATSENVSSHVEDVNMPDVHWTFFKTNENGETTFNPWSLIAPAQLEIPWTTHETKVAQVALPYDLSRQFDSAKALDPAAKDKVANYIASQLRQQLGERLHLLGEDIHRLKHGPETDAENMKVTQIKYLGTASPEGPQSKGPESIIPGNIDPENLKLAGIRLREADQSLMQALEKVGASPETLAQIRKEFKVEELQLVGQDSPALLELAKDEAGLDGVEKIFNLVIKYNEATHNPAYYESLTKGMSEVEKDALHKKFDGVAEILSTKRSVRAEVTFEGNRKHTLMIPLPLTPFLFIPFRRGPELGGRRQDERPNGPGNEPNGRPGERPVDEPVGRGPIFRPEEIPPIVGATQLPEPGTPQYERVSRQTLYDDLYLHFDDKETIARGIDYRALADLVVESTNQHKSAEHLENALTLKILQAWRAADLQARKEAGVEDVTGLDYEKDIRQIQYARMHAKAIIDLAQKKQADPASDYNEIIAKDPKFREALMQKTFDTL
ncbi:MAG: hypothetical protein WCK11_00740 [Candidatus Falkowbacteria bacterium]